VEGLWQRLPYTVKKILPDSWIIFDQTFQGLVLGTLFPARESLVSDIPAGDRKSLNLYSQCKFSLYIIPSLWLMAVNALASPSMTGEMA